MTSDLITHNRVARLAADLTPAAFACLLTYEPKSDEVSVASISGTSTLLFSKVNASARRTRSGWDPSTSAKVDTNAALKIVIRERKVHSANVEDFIAGVIEKSLIKSTFGQFNNHWCFAAPLVIDESVYGAILFLSPEKFTKPQEETCSKFVEQCRSSVSSLITELRLTKEIEKLADDRRRVQKNDPLGLTQRRGATSRAPREFEDIHLSIETQSAKRGNRELNLTRREFDLLDTFLQNPTIALSRVQIISRVWIERNGISSNVLNVTVKNLREKLEANGESRVTHSLRSYGYILKNSVD